MKLELGLLPTSLDDRLIVIKEQLTQLSEDKQPLVGEVPTYEELISAQFSSWNAITQLFHHSKNKLNKLLLRIHYKRSDDLSSEARLNVLKFLCKGYLITNDVRYFNEFLWFYKSNANSEDYWLLMQNNFHNNLDANNAHSFLPFPKQDVGDYIMEINTRAENVKNAGKQKKLNVGLIGIPFIFKNVYHQLKANGFSAKVILIPYYTEWKRRLFLKSGIVFKLFTKLKGVRFPYRMLNYPHTSKSIYSELKKEQFDIGYFKLGFIVKDNIYDAFKLGLLHDHLAVLPFIRGRSSLEFSLLHGIPPGSTIHFIGRGIDTGQIVKIYTYDIIKEDTIETIRKRVKSDFENRIYDSLSIVSHNSNTKIENDLSKGLSYYSMHPMLYDFINNNILPSK